MLLTSAVFADGPATVSRTDDGRAIVSITVPLSEDEGSLDATFDFGLTKGFLGPSANPAAQTGFSNADKSIVAVNHQPVTKCSYVHLFLRSSTSGDVTFINNVNGRVARLLTGKWAETAKHFLRIESLFDRTITFQTVDFSGANREEYEFTTTFTRDGTFVLASSASEQKTSNPTGKLPPPPKTVRDEQPAGLNLKTSLQNGPPPDVIEKALRNSVNKDPSWLPGYLNTPRSSHYQGYQYGLVSNSVKKAKITNEYTRSIEGEEIYIYDVEVDVEIAAHSPAESHTMESPKHATSVGIVRRGTKWYIHAVPE